MGVVEKLSFLSWPFCILFFSIFFASSPWKSVNRVARMGQNFDDYPGFQSKGYWANTYAQNCTCKKRPTLPTRFLSCCICAQVWSFFMTLLKSNRNSNHLHVKSKATPDPKQSKDKPISVITFNQLDLYPCKALLSGKTQSFCNCVGYLSSIENQGSLLTFLVSF